MSDEKFRRVVELECMEGLQAAQVWGSLRCPFQITDRRCFALVRAKERSAVPLLIA